MSAEEADKTPPDASASDSVRRDVAEDSPAAEPPVGVSLGQWAALAAGPLAALAVYFLLPGGSELGHAARAVAGLGAWMALWWMTEAAPLEATSLLPLSLLPLLGVYPAQVPTGEMGAFARAAAPYADPSIYLFFGGFLIALAIERWGLHRRLALLTLLAFGAKPPQLIAGFMAATAFLSMWISNTATAAMMLPIALSVVQLVKRRSQPSAAASGEGADPFAEALMLGVAYAASIGGMGTLIGTPTNTIFAGFMKKQGMEVDFAQWMLFATPTAAVFLLLGWLVLTRVAFRIRGGELSGGREMLRKELAELGPLRRGEALVLGLFLCTAAAWIAKRYVVSLLLPYWPGAGAIDDYSIAMTAAIALFLIPVEPSRGRFLLDWKSAQRLPWGVLLLFGGGLSLAEAMDATGLADWLGGRMSGLGVLPVPLLVLAVVAIVIAFSELASNVATATALLPLLLQVAKGLELEPRLLLVPAILAASCGFMLPVATPPNAIVFGSGYIRLRSMLRVGLLFDLLGLALIPLALWLWGWVL